MFAAIATYRSKAWQMGKQKRSDQGKFVSKSDEYRQVKSLRLTDKTWKALGSVADSQSITRADLIEQAVDTGLLEQSIVVNGVNLQRIEKAVVQVLNDPLVTRNGRDKGSIKRALEALIQRLS